MEASTHFPKENQERKIGTKVWFNLWYYHSDFFFVYFLLIQNKG